jgi:hypothetical protein
MRLLKRPRNRQEECIKVDLPDVRCGGMVCIDLIQDKERWLALVNAVTKFLVP